MHDDMDKCRNTFTSIQCQHKFTDFIIFGVVDDIWVDLQGSLIVVDYKVCSAKTILKLKT